MLEEGGQQLAGQLSALVLGQQWEYAGEELRQSLATDAAFAEAGGDQVLPDCVSEGLALHLAAAMVVLCQIAEDGGRSRVEPLVDHIEDVLVLVGEGELLAFGAHEGVHLPPADLNPQRGSSAL